MITRVVHVKSKEWAETPHNQRLYIGRRAYGYPASQWGNPFKVKYQVPEEEGARDEAIRNHEIWLREKCRRDSQLIISIRNLRGMVLGCWCKINAQPNRACHGDLLARLAEMSDQAYEDWLNE